MNTTLKPKASPFKPFIARTACCDSLLLLMRPRVYVTCKCGKSSVDAGDGYYMRTNIHEGVPQPAYYKQLKKGSLVMAVKKKKKSQDA